MTLHQLIEQASNRYPYRPALLAPGREPLTYAGLKAQAERTAASLNALGIGRGDPVAMLLPNGPEMASAFLSIGCAAATAPLNPTYQQAELSFYLGDLRAKAVVVARGVDTPARAVAASMGIPLIELAARRADPAGIFTLALDGSPAEKAHPLHPGFAESEDVALVLHTSGTTSRPKMVPLRQRNLVRSAGNIQAALQLSHEDRCLNVMPLFHIHGLMAAVLASIAAGASIVCTPGFYATDFFPWLAQFQPTWYTAVPTMHQSILERAAVHQEMLAGVKLRLVRSSSASLAPAVMQKLEQTFACPVIEAYGMTEAAHQMASNPLGAGRQKPGSVGLPAGPQVAIMQEEGGQILPPGQTGEIVIRGENVFSGYAANAEANAKAFTDGWFRTGDQGYFDADGYLFISGRIKELINRGGEKISPREIDEILLKHPAVAQAVTFAVPDRRLGEDVAAAVVLKQPGITAAELRAHVAQSAADFKVPRQVVFLEEIPKGPTGKLQRIGLAEKLGLSSSEEAAAPPARAYAAPRNDLEAQLAQIWAETLGLQQVGIHDPFIEAGGDSMLATRLVAGISERLGVKVNLLTLSDAPTIAAQAAVIAAMQGKEASLPSQSSLVTTFNPQGANPPFFFLSASTSDSYIFKGLAQGMGPDQPLYGLTPYGLHFERGVDVVRAIANRYLDEIRRIQPHGPYDLGGNCTGGLVAYEIAQRLSAAGERVRLLLFTETYGQHYPQQRGALARLFGPLLGVGHVLAKHYDFMRASNRAGRKFYLFHLWNRQKKRIHDFAVQRLSASFAARLNPGMYTYDVRIGQGYDPEPYEGDLVLLRAQHQPPAIHRDAHMGWDGLVRGSVLAEEIPGYHGGIYPGQRAAGIGRRARAHLDRCRAGSGQGRAG